jgi:hypothetical protein
VSEERESEKEIGETRLYWGSGAMGYGLWAVLP